MTVTIIKSKCFIVKNLSVLLLGFVTFLLKIFLCFLLPQVKRIFSISYEVIFELFRKVNLKHCSCNALLFP